MDIEKTGNNEYSITIFRNDFSPIRFTNIQIYKNCVLPFGVYRFVKESSNDPELKYVNTADPQMPVFQRIDAKNLLLTVPSALINSNILDSTLLAHEKEITSTENLILDVRSNLGGNSIWSSLIALANTKLYADPKNNNKDDFLLLASPDNAEYFNKMGSYFKQTKDSGGIAYYDNLARKIKENTGSIVGFSFYDPEIDTSRKKVYEFPKRVAIITDKGTASAGEAFVLSMKSNSTKVVVYGNNTYGMIDYMNVNTKKIPCQETSAYYYGYPTFFHPLSKRSL
ncbi:MAG: S41 family peptidase [Saprospiraceae bacterium]